MIIFGIEIGRCSILRNKRSDGCIFDFSPFISFFKDCTFMNTIIAQHLEFKKKSLCTKLGVNNIVSLSKGSNRAKIKIMNPLLVLEVC